MNTLREFAKIIRTTANYEAAKEMLLGLEAQSRVMGDWESRYPGCTYAEALIEARAEVEDDFSMWRDRQALASWLREGVDALPINERAKWWAARERTQEALRESLLDVEESLEQ